MKKFENNQASNFDNLNTDTLFNIRKVEMFEGSCFETTIPLHTNQYALFWITRGNGYYLVNNQKQYFNNATLLSVKPDSLNELTFGGNMQGYIISFTDSFLGKDYDPGSGYRFLPQIFSCLKEINIDPETEQDLLDITEIMFKEYKNHNMHRAEVLKRFFKIFLIYLSRQFDVAAQVIKPSRNQEIVQSFLTLLNKNFRSHKMVADYADQLAVTPNYLNEVVKKITGQSAGNHIRQRVAMEAKHQAAHPDNCMKKIAYDLGFCDMAHFSKFFKNTTGINFSDFKKTEVAFQPAI